LLCWLYLVFARIVTDDKQISDRSVVIKNYRLRWFGRVEHTADAGRIKHCKAMEVDGTRLKG